MIRGTFQIPFGENLLPHVEWCCICWTHTVILSLQFGSTVLKSAHASPHSMVKCMSNTHYSRDDSMMMCQSESTSESQDDDSIIVACRCVGPTHTVIWVSCMPARVEERACQPVWKSCMPACVEERACQTVWKSVHAMPALIRWWVNVEHTLFTWW